ncbi:uncharacterized protein G2W53_042877 [Senna tora]|uniref:Uncharacterized protein n=1 Tax=Senna tora TaxID=362788 RepID=A0A834W2V1_9FABA|nr:uncharacterized protein G2W53_042877 [Senna tora]
MGGVPDLPCSHHLKLHHQKQRRRRLSERKKGVRMRMRVWVEEDLKMVLVFVMD